MYGNEVKSEVTLTPCERVQQDGVSGKVEK